ncbi:MAG: leucine-rich repeat protein [Bacteroidaceae bacterium]|nr:leucine-rich repeat protein [Bacteroidaceae bacterium]
MQKNYLKQLFVAIVVLLCSVTVSAYDFEVDGIYYNITSETDLTVEVTSRGGSYTYYYRKIIMPETVTHNEKTYSVTSIGNYAFSSCSSLTSVTIPNSVTSIGIYAFNRCSGLTSITIPNSVTNRGDYAFRECYYLTSVTIPNSVTSIGNNAFYACSGLTSITIPNSVTSIGTDAFRACSGLISIVVESGNSVYDSRDNCNAIVKTSTNTIIKGCNKTIIPNSVTSIGNDAFLGCSGLTSATIPNSVTSIGTDAFRACSGLISITIGNSVTSIGNDAFSSCRSLTSVTIPNSVTSIGDHAFSSCSSLTSVTIGCGVTSIGDYAFTDIYKLRKVTLNCNYIRSWFSGKTCIQEVVIGDSVTSIMSAAFSGCSNLINITFGSGVKSIGRGAFENTAWYNNQPDGVVYAGKVLYSYKGEMPSGTSINIKEGTLGITDQVFYKCSGLTSITIPEGVTSIRSKTFYGCTGLKSITIPNSVTSIGDRAFYGCSGLTSVTIGRGVTSIGDYAFYCTNSNLTKIELNCDSIGRWFNQGSINEVIIGASVKSIGSCAFEGYRGLTSVTIPNSVTSIGDRAFYGCSGLTSVTIPNSVTSIGDRAFYGCSGLTSVTIGSGVTSIEYDAFFGCTYVSEIICYAAEPPTLGYNTFENISTDAVLKVLPSSLELYSSADGWKEFEAILPIDDNSIQLTLTLPDDAKDGKYKNLYLELCDEKGERIYKNIITDKKTYSFSVKKNGKYNIYMKNDKDVVFGSINDIKVEESAVNVEFALLLQPQQVEIKVLTPKSKDVTKEVKISWMDKDTAYLCQGSCINNTIEGTELYYKIELPNSLASMYATPQMSSYRVKNGENIIVCTLSAYEEIRVSGTILDATTNTPILDASITISQHFNSKHSKLLTLQIDKEGRFSGNIANVPFTMTAAAGGYISQTYDVSEANNAGVEKNFLLTAATGTVIASDFTFTPSVVAGDVAEKKDYYTDYANVEYSIYNATKNSPITNFKVQGSSIILMDETEIGDKLKITVTSKSSSFSPIVVEGVIDVTNKLKIEVPVVELGKLSVTFAASDNNNNVGILYDKNGRLIRKSNYDGDGLAISDIADGSYTLISMGYSKFFNSISDISNIESSGLVEGEDFVRHFVEISSGNITTINIASIPKFDESKFYYTDKNTAFTVNKPSTTIGNYLTMRAGVGFKAEYADAVSDPKLIFDIPEGCMFVDNSIIEGTTVCDYVLDNNRITIDLKNINSIIRFCIIPQIGGTYTPNAFVSFTFDGKEIVQPIGSAKFEAESMKLVVPEKTNSSMVTVRGVALSGSKIAIYDNEVLVGETTALANGEWNTKIELYKPHNLSYHSIYAEITDTKGNKYLSETKSLKYDKNGYVLTKVTMLNTNHTSNVPIVFDMLQGKCNNNLYYYQSGLSNFTFVAKFNKPDSTVIKNVEFVVLASDGTKRRLPGIYNDTKKAWVATSDYPNSNKLPINVNVEWFDLSSDTIDNSDYIAEDVDILVKQNKYIEEFWNSKDSVIVVEDTDSSFTLKFADTEYLSWTVSERDYEQTVSMTDTVQFNYENDGENWFCYYVSSNEDSLNIILVDFNEKTAIEITTKEENQNARPAQKKILGIANVVTGMGNLVMDLTDIDEYMDAGRDLQTLQNFLIETSERHSKMPNEIKKLLNAKCQNGEKRITPTIESLFLLDLEGIISSQNNYVNRFEKYLEEYRKRLTWHALANIATLGIGSKLSALAKSGKIVNQLGKNLLNSMGHGKTWWAHNSQSTAESFILNTGNLIYNGAIEEGSNIFRPSFTDFTGQGQKIWGWAPEASSKIIREYAELANKIKKAYRSCPEDEDDNDENDENGGDNDSGDNDEEAEDDDNFITTNLTPIIDPAGYVYEGVPSNRLEGVTVTCYYKETVEDMYGDKHENIVLWNAEGYGQQNPLLTDKNGMYRWDVPQGLWQVKFEKEGYETAYSEWLPVPPPQLEVNIAMTQYRQPEVKRAVAYEDAVEVEFDKYMKVETLTEDNFIVTQNGQPVKGAIELLNVENLEYDEKVRLASIVRFNANEPFTAEEVMLVVKKEVASYAGLTMAEDFSQKLKVEKEIKQIVVEEKVIVPYNGEKNISVSFEPATAAVGKTVNAKVESEALASLVEDKVTVDEEGKAIFIIKGELPGVTSVNFWIEGVRAIAQTTVNISDKEEFILEAPQASVESGSSVYKGTEVTLSAQGTDVKIWYTTDGTCPCDENGTRKLYSEPIVINENTTIKAMCENEEGTSDIATFVYNILGPTKITFASMGEQEKISVTPRIVENELLVEVHDERVRKVEILIYSAGGVIIRESKENSVSSGHYVESFMLADVPAGVYLVKILVNNESNIVRIIKK